VAPPHSRSAAPRTPEAGRTGRPAM